MVTSTNVNVIILFCKNMTHSLLACKVGFSRQTKFTLNSYGSVTIACTWQESSGQDANVVMKFPYKVKYFNIRCFEFLQIFYFVVKKTLFKEVHVIISPKHLSFV